MIIFRRFYFQTLTALMLLICISKSEGASVNSTTSSRDENTTTTTKLSSTPTVEDKVHNISSLNDTTHCGRENIIKDCIDSTVIYSEKQNTTLSSLQNKSSEAKPANKTADLNNKDSVFKSNDSPFVIPEKNDGKKSVPKKGAPLDTITPSGANITAGNSISTIPSPPVINATSLETTHIIKAATLTTNKTSSLKNTTSAANKTLAISTTIAVPEKPRKPLFTEASDDLPYAPSNFAPKSKSSGFSNIPSMENLSEEEKDHRSADYIVPIVAVILSVPLVAIIISVLYKRGSEWWYHRHYRRMDFLIEGMYNN